MFDQFLTHLRFIVHHVVFSYYFFAHIFASIGLYYSKGGLDRKFYKKENASLCLSSFHIIASVIRVCKENFIKQEKFFLYFGFYIESVITIRICFPFAVLWTDCPCFSLEGRIRSIQDPRSKHYDWVMDACFIQIGNSISKFLLLRKSISDIYTG